MFFLAAGDNAIEHVLDKTLIEIGGVPVLTMHMVTLVAAAAGLLWIMSMAARSIATGPASMGNERYLAKGRLTQLIELMVVYLRDQMIKPVIGEDATRIYLPYLLTVFFFILANNLLGLIPLVDLQHLLGIDELTGGKTWIGGTATSNLAVTGALALVSFLVIQVHGYQQLGVKGWLKHLLGGAPWWLFPIMVPVELAGHLIKPAALAIRLFANMVAGHTLLATLVLFGYAAARGGSGLLGVGGITLASGIFAVLISFLELFVAVLQAFIFMFLTAVFISLMSHHDEHGEHLEQPTGEPGAVPAET
ncbi:MAG: F0F1 ATP synthase subunit A [Planctomycetota bacterium]|jgi:F-type H+-transporting ATPase subunit a